MPRGMAQGTVHGLTNKNLKMKIDGANIVVLILFMALFGLPFVLDRMRQKRKKLQLISSLNGLAEAHQSKVHQHDTCAGIALGLDQDRNLLFHIDQREGATPSGHIDLSQVRSCRVVKAERNAKGVHADARLERVELSFVPKDPGKGAMGLVLFDSSSGNLMAGEEQFADKWSQVINERLKDQ